MPELQHELFDETGNANSLGDPVQDKRLNRQQAAVLERLQQGPATNMDLIPISTRFSSRIYELRKAGWRIETDYIDKAKGITQYTLKGRK